MRYRINDFVLDAERFELSHRDASLKAEPQVIELLILLIENRDRMVSKEEINDRVWNGRIVSEAALSSRIKSLRQLLGDNGREQTVIRTIHKKGFRLVADVELLTPAPKAERESEAQPNTVSEMPVQQRQPTIAVLPFANLSDDQEQEYFSDGVTSDIIALLAKHRWLRLIARNTTLGYKGKAVDVKQLGQQLGADYVVEGSVRKAGNRVRVNVHLIDCDNGHQTWGDRYDRELDDIFELQDEITETIAARLEPEIGYAERNRVIRSRPASLQAWDCFHLGTHHFFQFTGNDNLEAQKRFLQSQQLDHHFGDAYAWWAYALVLGMIYWETPPSQPLLDQALTACDRALSIDSQNATFYALRARTLLARQEYDRAIHENKIAIKLNPSFAAAHCGLGDSYAYEGRYDEAIECFKKAIALSPNDPQLWAFLTYGALAFLFQGDYESTLKWTEKASSIPNCQYWTQAHRAVALAHLGRIEEGKAVLAQLKGTLPKFSLAFVREKLFYLKLEQQIEHYVNGLKKLGCE